jgi:dihydroxyacetone kinase
VTSIYDPEATYVGLDVHKDTISVGVLEPGSQSAVVDKIFHDEESVRRLAGRLSEHHRLRDTADFAVLCAACSTSEPTGSSATG